MGTNRLGTLPRTKKWKHIVATFAAGAGAEQVARESLEEMSEQFATAQNDAGVIETVRILMVLPLAARSGDFAGSLRGIGLAIDDDPDFFDVTAAISAKLDSPRPGVRRTDLAELAQATIHETLTEVVGGKLRNLFDGGPDDVLAEFARQRTKANFGALAATFFGKLLSNCLDSYLSRELPSHVGNGQRLPKLADHAAFRDGLDLHCREAAKIVEQYAGDWYSKEIHEQEREIDPSRVGVFLHGAFAKLDKELKAGAAR